jgi:hypothetical protein
MRILKIWNTVYNYGPEDGARAKDRKGAAKLAPWAAKIAKCADGWWAFESLADYQTWKNQK